MRDAAAAVGLVALACALLAIERAGWRWPMQRFDRWLNQERP